MKPQCVIVHNHPIHYKHLLFKALAKEGMSFEVLFTGAFSGQRIERPLPERDEYRYRLGFDGPYERVPMVVAVAFVWRSLAKLNPSIVIISGYYDVAAWTAWAWAVLHGAKRIIWAESNEFDHERYLIKELPKRLFVKNCNAAHVYGVSSSRYIEKLGMPTGKIYVKRALADTNLFQDRQRIEPRLNARKELLYVGRFAQEKNLPFLFRALHGMKQDRHSPILCVSLVGYGPMESELRTLRTQLDLDHVVRFSGQALQAELPEIFRAADALVLPSTCEPWGLVANEAMLCGLPILVSTQCGCATDLCLQETGWSFSPWSQSELTRLLELVAATPRKHLREMGSAAAKLARDYSAENCAKIVCQSVRELTKV